MKPKDKKKVPAKMVNRTRSAAGGGGRTPGKGKQIQAKAHEKLPKAAKAGPAKSAKGPAKKGARQSDLAKVKTGRAAAGQAKLSKQAKIAKSKAGGEFRSRNPPRGEANKVGHRGERGDARNLAQKRVQSKPVQKRRAHAVAAEGKQAAKKQQESAPENAPETGTPAEAIQVDPEAVDAPVPPPISDERAERPQAKRR